ncbi:MAG TPA: hypothetical protein VIH59_07680 [Candidatus Tectomicrobia bacterium]
MPNGVYVVRKDGAIERFPTGKVNPLRLDEGDGYAVETAGGGGFGNPLGRPAEQVLRDVTSGYVSVEAARRNYGVVIHAQGATMRSMWQRLRRDGGRWLTRKLIHSGPQVSPSLGEAGLQ